MQETIKTLAKLIEEKVEAGLFASVEDAVDGIGDWLEELERNYVEAQMRMRTLRAGVCAGQVLTVSYDDDVAPFATWLAAC